MVSPGGIPGQRDNSSIAMSPPWQRGFKSSGGQRVFSFGAQHLPNRKGIGHLAFQVLDVAETLARVLERGGSTQDNVVSLPVPGKGVVTFVYAADPEDRSY
jgi:predicted enzyme related to lactoylglutathione lyase